MVGNQGLEGYMGFARLACAVPFSLLCVLATQVVFGCALTVARLLARNATRQKTTPSDEGAVFCLVGDQGLEPWTR